MAIRQDARWHPDMLLVLEMIDSNRAKAAAEAAGQPYAVQRDLINAATRFARDNAPEIKTVEDIRIPARGRQVCCRAYRPAPGMGPEPVVLFLHGGGWTAGSLDTHDKFCRDIAVASGWSVLSVDYALAPEAVFPQALNEVLEVVAHLRRRGADLGFDATRIILAGDSAGGNLALGTALYMRDCGATPVAGLIAAYPVCDCDFGTESYIEFGEGCYLTTDLMRNFWSLYTPGLVDRYHPYAAPLRGALHGLPPSLFLLAAMDPLCSEGEMLAARMKAAGNPSQCTVYPGVGHAFMSHANRVASGRQAFEDMGVWIREMGL